MNTPQPSRHRPRAGTLLLVTIAAVLALLLPGGAADDPTCSTSTASPSPAPSPNLWPSGK